MIRAVFCPVFLCLPLVAACAASQDDAYPRLLPLDQLIAPPMLPAHAAEAAADPTSVAADLRARAATAEMRAAGTPTPVTDAAALQRRAADLRARAQALQATDPGASTLPDCAPDAADCQNP